MENWGLIAYSPGFLINENSTSWLYKMFRSLVIAHEASHQWFGNVITPKWWSYVWLKEGFSRLLEVIVVDKVSRKTNAIDVSDIGLYQMYHFRSQLDVSAI